jgi:hypothetical protein
MTFFHKPADYDAFLKVLREALEYPVDLLRHRFQEISSDPFLGPVDVATTSGRAPQSRSGSSVVL